MRCICLAATLLATLGCPAPESDLSSSDLLGVWQSRESGEMPKACREASMEFRGDGTMLVRTGEQILTGAYTAEPAGNRLRVVQRDVRANGRPNCQGISADYVLEHYAYRFYAEVRGDTLGIYLRPR